MATVYKQVVKYQKDKKANPLSADQMVELGKLAIETYLKVKPKKWPIHRKQQVEPTGTHLVIEYPNMFSPEIDKIIGEYYASIQPKVRKRIPVRKHKLWQNSER